MRPMYSNEGQRGIASQSYLLPYPVLEKRTWYTANDRVEVATSSMQGWRTYMEDVSVILLGIPGDRTHTMYFAVFDGHGGTSAAEYAGANLHKYIMNQLEWESSLQEAIYKGYTGCDERMRRDSTADMSGATALTVFIRGDILCCGNVGDSRAIACEGGRVVRLSFDHKPNAPSEKRRILAAGGYVEFNRVNGNLALSRALGDFQYKGNYVNPEFQIVSSAPDVITKKINKNWEFIVLACDGIWEVLTNEAVAEFIRNRLDRMPLERICEDLISKCVSPSCNGVATGCDNMSVIIVRLKTRLSAKRTTRRKKFGDKSVKQP